MTSQLQMHSGIKLPPTDIKALMGEIHRRGPELALPCKMPQKWLLRLARDIVLSRRLEADYVGGADDPADYIGSVLMMIVAILGAQHESKGSSVGSEFHFTTQDVHQFVDTYNILVLEELAARTTGVRTARYDLKTIFA